MSSPFSCTTEIFTGSPGVVAQGRMEPELGNLDERADVPARLARSRAASPAVAHPHPLCAGGQMRNPLPSARSPFTSET